MAGHKNGIQGIDEASEPGKVGSIDTLNAADGNADRVDGNWIVLRHLLQ